jgi:hypothetical protein
MSKAETKQNSCTEKSAIFCNFTKHYNADNKKITATLYFNHNLEISIEKTHC